MEIRFHSEVYPLSAVQKAVAGFRGIAEFTVKHNSGYYTVRVKGYDKSHELQIKGNFLNYVLILSRQN
jgi:hypothetical protein